MDDFGSLQEVEGALRAAGFFEGGADGLVADVYLGYGLSHPLRRTSTPDPPEPCPLPLAAVGIRADDEVSAPPGHFEIGEWERSWHDELVRGGCRGRPDGDRGR